MTVLGDATAGARGAGRRPAPRRAEGLLALVGAAVADDPGRTAVAAASGEPLTYGALERRAAAVAAALTARGVEPGARVAVLSGERAAVIPAVLGILAAGAAFVPLDPAQPEARLATLLDAVSPAAYLITGDQAGRLPASAAPAIDLEGLTPVDGPLRDDRAPGPDDLAYVYFTSGSTGAPKPIAGRLKGVEHFLRWQRELVGAGPDLRVSQLTSPGFDAWLRDVFLPLTCGGSVHLPPDDGDGVDARRLVAWLDDAAVEVVHCVPSLLRTLLAEPLTAEHFSHLRWLFLAGERLLPADVGRWFEVFGPRVQMVNLYGATETTMTKLFHRVEPADAAAARVPVGRPMPGVRALVVDDDGRPCADGSVGEIWIRTPYRTLGYFERPRETRHVFVPNPFSDDPQDLVYRSGDYGRRRPDGLFELHGRRDDLVKVRGARVELGEVENAVRRHPAVRDLAVIDRRDAGGDTYLAAYVVGEVGGEELARHCASILPAWMVPSLFVPMDELPRTVNGKLDRNALPDPAAATGGGRPPRGEVEEGLARIWCRLLDRERVSAEDDFFLLGGHSLLATRLQSRLRSELGADVGLAELFEQPVLAEQARLVETARRRGEATALPPLEPAPADAEPVASLAEERLWLLWRLAPDGAAYNMARSLRLHGALDPGALRRAFAEVVRRHQILRTVYRERRGRPVPRVRPAAGFRLPLIDLSTLPEAPRRRTAGALARREARRPFDLAGGGVFRARLVRLGAAEHALLVTLHHVAGDAWSLDVLAGELGSLYDAFAAGRPSPLPEPRLQYRDVAVWERRCLRRRPLDDDLAFWRRELAGAPEALTLPTDRPRPPLPSYRGGAVPFALQAAATERLERLAREEGATLFMVLLAAFAALLGRRAGQPEVVVGTSVANRAHPDTEGVLGLFVNQVPLRVDLSAEPSFRRLVGRVRRATLDAFAHQRVPFQRLLDELRPPRVAGRNPLFQVMLELDQRPAGRAAGDADGTDGGLRLEPLPGRRDRARVDLTLFAARRGDGLEGKLEYSADLFDESTARALTAAVAALLADAAADPATRLDKLRTTSETERQEKLMKQSDDLRATLDRFKSVQPRAVEVPGGELVESRELEPGRSLPLLLVPAADEVDLAEWAASNRERLDRDLLDHGAILFRGFAVGDVDAFETVARALCGELFRDNGEHDRETVSGDVATPTFYPPEKKLLWHNENSFNHRWPGRIVFGCHTPAAEGGETPLADSREMYRRIDPQVRRRFAELGVQYVRNYGTGFGLDWQTVFQTDSRDEVERLCGEERMEAEWLDGDRLRTRCTRPAVIRHPDSGVWSWFNQAQHFHPACLDPDVRGSLQELFGGGDEMPRNCRYGDGSPIPDAVMEAILDLYRELEVSFPWRSGDVLMVDNVLTAHARNPYRGERKLFIGMGRMHSYDSPGVAAGAREDG